MKQKKSIKRKIKELPFIILLLVLIPFFYIAYRLSLIGEKK